ncbi:MAG: DUF1203 domain-containing protein [Pseudoxanthomonas sp.]|jgi:hypothetical protein|uniref:DUF1203 domain-containing protein n=1 Tax=Pseudoxanthomonas TaxID=83618 RepID=UPI00258C0792|nr:DUF1203 domain-containing protein [Pseudoxanthomonas sp.]MCH2093432.1 DUF1203 domain-containing protein [Pseudoxanthomonas sp.]
MSFVIHGLSPDTFRPLFALDDGALAARNIRRVVADADRGFPCRVTLEDARQGETLLLLPFVHHDVAGPYRASGPIYVREAAMQQPAAVFRGTLPPSFPRRLLSLRAYDADGLMRDADVVEGSDALSHLQRLLALPDVAYVHVHNARPGCYACRVDPA